MLLSSIMAAEMLTTNDLVENIIPAGLTAKTIIDDYSVAIENTVKESTD